MAFVATGATREEKRDWLLRPISWASSVAWFSSTFGVVYYAFGLASDRLIIMALIAALAANVVLLMWAISRIATVTRG